MKIIKIEAENFKRLVAIDITPNDSFNEIVGKNRSGKSSLIDCIPALTGGANGVPGMPIRLGEEKGRIKMALGDGPDRIEYWVSKSFTKKNTNGILKIEDASGNAINESPQALLDKIRSKISFDPLDLIERTDKAELKKILFKVLGINIDELDSREKQLRQDREKLSSVVKKAEGAYKSIEYFPQVKETEEVKVGVLIDKLQKAIAYNQELKDRAEKNERLKQSAITNKQTIENLKLQIVDLEAKVTIQRDQYKAEKDDLALCFPDDVTVINAEIQTIEESNIKIRKNMERKKAQEDYDTKKSEYDSYTCQIDEVLNKKQQLLKSAKWPIPGFSYTDGELYFNDIPVDQINDADKLRVGMAIAMGQNPELRVIWTRRGSLVDSENRAIIKEIIKEKDFQLFFEGIKERDENGNVPTMGFYIEDGGCKAIDGVAVEPVKQKCEPKPKKSEPIPVKAAEKDEEW